MTVTAREISFDFAPFASSGLLYGTLLNHSSALAALGDTLGSPPYHAAPRAPILYVKPRNTFRLSGEAVEIPATVPEVEVAVCLGLLIGRTACNVSRSAAPDHVAGYLLVNDVSIPHPDYYRPSIRYKAQDGFCPLGPVVERSRIANPDALTLRTFIDGVLVQTVLTAQLVRSTAALLSEVSEFMTLSVGDILTVGAGAPAPRAHAGQLVTMQSEGFAPLSNRFVAGPA